MNAHRLPFTVVTRCWCGRWVFSWLVLALFLIAAPVEAQGAGELADQGRKALASADYEGALKSFRAGFKATSDSDEQAKFIFYQAVTMQQQESLPEAVKLYQEYLRHKPNSGSALNNLAQVYAKLGKEEAAEKSFRRAIARNDAKNAFYRRNYAEFLDSAGRWKDATNAWTRLIDGHPELDSSHQAMMERYLASAPTDQPWSDLDRRQRQRRSARGQEMVEYLWQRRQNGQPKRAMWGALAALEDAGQWSKDLRRELLTVVAVGLAGQHYDPGAFLTSETAKKLASLRRARDIGPGVVELLQLHQVVNPMLKRSDYRWWKWGDEANDPSRGVWPVDGFLRLIRSLGRSYQQAKQIELAEAYFRLAADFRGDDVDPEAISDLVALYAGENRLDQVSEVAERYEERLFGGKVQAYRGSKTEQIFEYHRTLGGIYSLTESWGDEQTVTSAIFQLDRALEAYQRMEADTPELAARKAQYTPEINSLLAKGLESTGREEESYAVRISAAETYQRQGNLEAATEVLRPIVAKPPPERVDSSLKVRYAQVMTQVEPVQPQIDRDRLRTPDFRLPDSRPPDSRVPDQQRPDSQLPIQRDQVWKRQAPAVDFYNEGLRIASTDLSEAEKKFRQALEVDPDLTDAYVALAGLQLRKGDFDQALSTTEELLEVEPDHRQGQIIRYLAADASGSRREAQAALDALERLDPQAAARIHLKRAESALREGDKRLAERTLARCIQLAGNDSELAPLIRALAEKLKEY